MRDFPQFRQNSLRISTRDHPSFLWSHHISKRFFCQIQWWSPKCCEIIRKTANIKFVALQKSWTLIVSCKFSRKNRFRHNRELTFLNLGHLHCLPPIPASLWVKSTAMLPCCWRTWESVTQWVPGSFASVHYTVPHVKGFGFGYLELFRETR